jgi:hypothetical protein
LKDTLYGHQTGEASSRSLDFSPSAGIQPRQDLNGNVRAISFILGKGEKKQ